ncbi:MAG: thioredoxin family protein [Cyclobacteriaceae bacterium]
MPTVINQHHLESGLSYSMYRKLIDDLLAEGKTTGTSQSEGAVAITKLNVQRMRRLDKTVKLQPDLLVELEQLDQPWVWLVLTEGWCGDSAQNIPVFAKAAEINPNIKLLTLLVSDYPEVMDAYLTDGSRSIPKLICLTQNLEELGTWGSRPQPGKEILQKYKKQYGDQFRDHYDEFTEELHLWYGRDRTQTIQAELTESIRTWLKAYQS